MYKVLNFLCMVDSRVIHNNDTLQTRIRIGHRKLKHMTSKYTRHWCYEYTQAHHIVTQIIHEGISMELSLNNLCSNNSFIQCQSCDHRQPPLPHKGIMLFNLGPNSRMTPQMCICPVIL